MTVSLAARIAVLAMVLATLAMTWPAPLAGTHLAWGAASCAVLA